MRDRSCPFVLRFSMIPAEARWVFRIYLPTTNCSSFSQLGIKDCLSCYIYAYIHIYIYIHILVYIFICIYNIFTVLVFSVNRERKNMLISQPPTPTFLTLPILLLSLPSSRSRVVVSSLSYISTRPLTHSLIIVDPFLYFARCGSYEE